MNKLSLLSLLSVVVLSISVSAQAAEEIRRVQPEVLGPVVMDLAGVDSELTVDQSMADDFAREALGESDDRPIYEQKLVARVSEGRTQMFWMVKLVGSWKTAYVFANGEREGATLIEDERTKTTAAAPLVSGR